MNRFGIQFLFGATSNAGADLPLGSKGLCLVPPISESPRILEVKTISSISVSLLFVFLFWFDARFFTIPLTKDLYRRMSAKD